jgi:hypothetical protein
LVLAILSVALSACAPLAVQALHAPFHPSSSDQVTFTADAQAARGVSEISILQRTFEQRGFCAAYVAGKCKPLPTLGVKTIKTCTFEARPPNAHCETTVGPFGDGTFVTYGASVKDAAGQTGEDQWIGFAAGKQDDPNEPVPVYTRGSSATTIDVVLIPVDYDGSPGRTYRNFVDDARRFITEGYLAHANITDNRGKWNFYVNPVTGGLIQTTIGSSVSRGVTEPANWSRISSLADTVGYVHNNGAWRDFAIFNDAGVAHFTILASTPGTIVHETGHAIFGLSDEYCCDGGTVTTSWPHDNLFNNQSACQTSATAHSVPVAACTQLSSTNGFCGGRDASGNPVLGVTNGLWRQDTAADLMGCGGNAGAAGGVLDGARIRWFYDGL